MTQKKGELTVEAIIKIVIVLVILFIILFLVMMYTGSMDEIWNRLMGNI